MGLTAFAIFVVPWMLLAIWLFRFPSAIRLGAPSPPWRPLTPGRDWLLEQQRRETIREQQLRESHRRSTAAPAGSGLAGRDKHEPHSMPDGGALGTSVEDTEPKE
ncbi:hypothetical protein FPV16_21265 [Methylobacterium sp. W2]|nr:hypothetical protein [Methylobacterium sp. W2]